MKMKVRCLFTQLNELCTLKNGERKWLEKYRWIKFEEKVEEAGDHWSKPHVGILNLVHIDELKSCLSDSIFCLDLEANSLDEIIDKVMVQADVENVLNSSQIEELRVLLKQKCKGPSRVAKKASQLGSQMSLAKAGSSEPSIKRPFLDVKGADAECLVDDDEKADKFDTRFKKKIPQGSEVANILVAELGVFSRNVTLFIRLKWPLLIGKYSEVKIPTRFLAMFFGPENKSRCRVECGRVMGTLFSDNIFRETIYSATSAKEIIRAIDDFKDNVFVIPPSEWHPEIRIDPPKEKIPFRSQISKTQDHDCNPILSSLDGKENEGDDESIGLVRTHRLFGGLIDDVRRKAPFYLSDFRDALHPQCLASFIFLYFACLTPIITFGGLLMKATEGYLGAMESILAGCIVGVVYSIFSGQPLTILGSTGPILVFETIIFNLCDKFDLTFLSFRFWIGIWIMIILLLMVMFDLSFLVKYITKFTEESFAMLIALIYIYQAFKKLIDLLDDYPMNQNWTPYYVLNRTCACIPPENKTLTEVPKGDHLKRLLKFERPPLLEGYRNATGLNIIDYINWPRISEGYFSWETHEYKQICLDYGGHWIGNTCGKVFVPDVFFFSWLITLGTFILAMALKKFRNSRILPSSVRMMVSQFGVVIAIGTFSLLDNLIGLHTPKLKVPSKLEPTLGYSVRGWIVPIFGKNPWWIIIVAIPPAILASILVFMDQQITAVIVNRQKHKFKKSYGYHLDLLIVALLIGVNSLLGIPWFVAATVLSLNHVMSLKKESTNNAPGEPAVFLGCREQRVTHLLIFVFIGLTVFMTPLLKRIPMAVLYGVFLYMGFGPLGEMEFVQRIGMFFMSQKNRPDHKYLRSIPIARVHIYTVIQIICFILLWTIKSVKQLSIGFPIMVLAMCFIRKGLECCFSYRELQLLDEILPGVSPDQQLCKYCGPCGAGSKDEEADAFVPLSPCTSLEKEEDVNGALHRRVSVIYTKMSDTTAPVAMQMQERPIITVDPPSRDSFVDDK